MRSRRSRIPAATLPSMARLIALAGLLSLVAADVAQAQRPFHVYDPFYRNETARRVFFDSYSVTTEVSCCSAADSLQSGGLPSSAGVFGLPLGLGFHVNYQLGPQVDISAIIDAAGSSTGRTLSVSWLAMKYYWTIDNADYAFRLAVDPSLDGQIGFPQLDLAFLSTVLLTPMISNDFAIGARRIRMGYQRWISEGGERDIVYSRALGYELHAMLSYNLLLDPAGSNVFMSVVGEGGSYTLFETSQREIQQTAAHKDEEPQDGDATWKSDYRGGVIWLRSGVTFSRPGYQVAPYVSLPLQQWRPPDDERAVSNLHAGLRLMLR